MAKDEIPTTKAGIYQLQQPEKLSKVLSEGQEVGDCTSCRIMGMKYFSSLWKAQRDIH